MSLGHHKQLVAMMLAEDWRGIVNAPRHRWRGLDEVDYYALIMAHHRLGDPERAIRLGREGRELYPRAPGIVDRMMLPMLRGHRYVESIALYNDARPRLFPETHREAMANLVGNTIVAYAQTGRAKAGVDVLGDEIPRWESPLLYGNAACLYAVTGQPSIALDWMEKALALGKPRSFFLTDPDLASLRDLPRFRQLLQLPVKHPARTTQRSLGLELAAAGSFGALFWIIDRRKRLAGVRRLRQSTPVPSRSPGIIGV